MVRLAFWLALLGLIFQTAPVAVSICACAPLQSLETPLCVPCKNCCDQAAIPAALTGAQSVFQTSPVLHFSFFPISFALTKTLQTGEFAPTFGGAIEHAQERDLPPPRQLYGPIFSCRAPPQSV